jgi:O-acetylhomoserine/O-acetylserine sulfhydrylase-like pyridoxal-dependent enzyme
MKYPIGIQNFGEIRRGGYIYVDKTPQMWKMIDEGKYYFLSRPRRFGKSLMISTLEAFFSGERELFKGLFIDTVEWDWKQYPIIHKFLRYTLSKVFYTGHLIPFKDKPAVFWRALRSGYLKYIGLKSSIVFWVK